MKKLTDILENKNVILDENSDASLEILLNEAETKPPENTDVGIVLSRLSDMISMSDDLYDTASSLEEIDKETADAVESTYNSLDELYAMFDDKYDIFRSDFDMGDIEMDEDFRISLDDLLNEATDELSEAFLRLPGHFINNELYGVERDLNTFIKGLQNGNDVNMKELNKIIKILQSAKKEVKKFNKPEDVPVSFQYKKESIDINEYFSKADLKLIDKMYDKKGNLTPLGRKVMNHGKKPGDKGYIEEAKRRNQGLTDLFHNLAEVERQLRPNSPIHRLVEKTAEGNYTAEFKKMQKLVAPLVKMWDDIEADLDTDYPRESIEEAKMSPEDTKLAQEIIKSEVGRRRRHHQRAKRQLIKKYGKDWAKMVESINEAGGDWVVVDLNTKKVTYVKSYDAASKYVKKNGGVIASAEYYVDNKKKFEDTSFEGEPLDEAKQISNDDWTFYTDFDQGKYDSWVKRNKTIVTKWVKLDNNGKHVFYNKKTSGADKALVAEQKTIEEAVSGSTLSILKKVGFKEAPVDKTTTKVVNSLSGKKLKLTQLFGISMRAGKWADIFVGSTEDGKYFVVDPSGTTIFNKESELVTALKSAALGESINHFLKGGKDLNDIVG